MQIISRVPTVAKQMSQVAKTCLRGLTRSGTNRAVKSQKMVRGLKFQIYEEEGLYYLCSENKGTDQLARSHCALVFAYAKSRFSNDQPGFEVPISPRVIPLGKPGFTRVGF